MTETVTGGARRLRRIDLLLALAVLAMAAPFLREWSTQPASRYLFTVAIVDTQRLSIDPYRGSLGIDYAVIDGHTYSDKAPYQPMFATPVYRLYEALGGEPFPPGIAGRDVDQRADIGLWLVTLWSAALPAAVLVVLLRRHVSRTYPKQAVPVALSLLFGTVLLPFSSLLFGHLLAATVGFAAWFLLRRPEAGAVALFGAGVLLGLGPGIEYPQVLVAAVLGISSIVTHRWRAAWVAAGGVVGLLPLLVINSITFGGPLKTAYQGYLPNFQGSGAFGVYNLVAPNPRQFALALIGDRGLLSLTPIMFIAVAGCVVAIRNRTRARTDAIVALVLFALFLLTSTGIDGYGGASPGPRYLVPIIPFFALPLAEGWRRWRMLSAITAGLSVFWMVLATITDPLYEAGGSALGDWLSRLVRLDFARSVPGALIGGPAILVMVALAAAAATAAWRMSTRSDAPAEASPELSPTR